MRNKNSLTDIEKDELLTQFAQATRTPQGKYSAAQSYPKLQHRIASASEHRTRFSRPRFKWMAAASVAALLIATTWMAMLYNAPAKLISVETLADTKTITLPDGSNVTLNRYTTLTYPETFKDSIRPITLQGEAYFEVQKNTEQPFIVQAAEVTTRVLGTAFNLSAYSSADEIVTTLIEGSVQVTAANNPCSIILKPNEQATYQRSSGTLTSSYIIKAQNEYAWKEGKLIFNLLPLQTIAQELSQHFNTPITVDTSIQSFCITALFEEDESLQEILRLLETVAPFEIKYRKDKTILLKSKLTKSK
jgi:ferric-dicitrate binding protein FerR (iron transport regulator)